MTAVDLETSSAAFSPPPIALYEPAGRRGTTTPGDDVVHSVPRRFLKAWMERHQSLGTVDEIISEDAVSERVESWLSQRVAQDRIKFEIERRLLELKIDASLAGEPFSEDSLADFNTFMASLTLRERPSIFLLNNGNLRALWRNQDDEQVGLQFMGHELVQYVMFARRPNSQQMLRHAGRDMLSEMRAKITANGCDHLIG